MIHIVNAENRANFAADLHAMHRQRQRSSWMASVGTCRASEQEITLRSTTDLFVAPCRGDHRSVVIAPTFGL